MKYQSSIFVSSFVLPAIIGLSLSASTGEVTGTTNNGEQVVVRGTIYVDESQHENLKKNCTDTNQRSNSSKNRNSDVIVRNINYDGDFEKSSYYVPNGPRSSVENNPHGKNINSDVPDVIVVEHEDDHSKCRGGSCNHQFQPDNIRGNVPTVNLPAKSITIERPIGGKNINFDRNFENPSYYVPHGSRSSVINYAGSNTIPNGNTGNTITVHVIEGDSGRDRENKYTDITPSRVINNNGKIPLGSNVHQGNADPIIQILKKSGILDRGNANIDGQSGLDKYLQIVKNRDTQTGGPVFTYKRRPCNSGLSSGSTVRIVSNNVPVFNSGNWDISEIPIETSAGNSFIGGGCRSPSSGSITIVDHGNQFGDHPSRGQNILEMSGQRFGNGAQSSITTYPSFSGGSSGGLSGIDRTIHVIDTQDEVGSSLGLANIGSLYDGFGNDGSNGEYVSSDSVGDVLYVEGYYANGKYVPPHYDTVYDYLRHHA